MRAVIERVGLRWWRALAIAAAIALYVMAVSNRSYEMTTPVTLPLHELLRKIYALVAFALLGFLLEKSRLPLFRSTFAAGISVALYSYAIEWGQIVIDHTRETFAQHSFDVASGFAGGAIGAFAARAIREGSIRLRRREAMLIAVLLLALAYAFTVTYAPLDRGFRAGPVGIPGAKAASRSVPPISSTLIPRKGDLR